MMRRRWPEARIVHELVLEQSTIRIDLAAIGADFIALTEIKSERDTLSRLRAQLAKMAVVADYIWLCVTPKHESAIAELLREHDETSTHLRATQILIERGPAESALGLYPQNPPHALIADPRAVFDLLWAPEMVRALAPYFDAGGRRERMTRAAVENLTGGQIRRAVCKELRARRFTRADEPIIYWTRAPKAQPQLLSLGSAA